MANKRHTAEEIVANLRHVNVLMAQGRLVADAVRLGRERIERFVLTRENNLLAADFASQIEKFRCELPIPVWAATCGPASRNGDG